MNREYDRLLNDDIKHTNLVIPYCKYITATTFPEQDTTVLGTNVELRYRDMYKPDFPEEDMGKEELLEEHDIYSGSFYVVRFDKTSPYRMIAISEDRMIILVLDSRYYKTQVVEYPIQFNEYIGLLVNDQYVGEISEIQGVTLRVDNGEPCESVIVEFYKDNTLRFLVGEECQSKLYDYYGFKDYNGDSPTNHEDAVDVDGHYPSFKDVTLFEVINGGPANILHDLLSESKTREEIATMINTILEGKELYANN